MPIDLMRGESPTANDQTSSRSIPEYAVKLKDRLKEAYTRVRLNMGHKLDRQKDLYDRRVHGKPFKENDLAWLHTTVVPKGVGRKLHRPWTGPFRIIKKLSDSVYRLHHVCSPRH